jgi:hypothetical protein
MLVYRLYVALLALVFLLLALFQQRIGVLEAIVVTCALLFLILDTRQDLQLFKRLERQITSLLDGI